MIFKGIFLYFNTGDTMTTVDKLIELTKAEKISWVSSQDGIYKTFNNNICIRLEYDGYGGFALKVDTAFVALTADGTYDSDKLELLYKEVLPRSQKTVEDKFFEGLIL